MTLFRKLTRLITPPPARPTPESGERKWVFEEPPLGAVLKPLLKSLVEAASLDEPAVEEVLSTLKQTALKKGLYVTAFEMKARLDAMPIVGDSGTFLHKDRGYLLVADFILGHIHRELEAMATKAVPIGPNVFKSYCNEMVGCLLESDNVERAVEIPVLLIDQLFSKTLDDAQRSQAYLLLAEQALASALELNTNRVQLRQATPLPRKAGTPAPAAAAPSPDIGNAALEYLDELGKKLEQMRKLFLKPNAFIVKEERFAAPLPVDLAKSCERALAVLRMAEAAEWPAFQAIANQRIAEWLATVQPETAIRFYAASAECYKRQGDREYRFALARLSLKRYEKARACFVKAGDSERAAKVQAEIDRTHASGRSS